MSKFAAALNARSPQSDLAGPEADPQKMEQQVSSEHRPVSHSRRKVGRPAGKRSDDSNTQVTGYVPAQLYYDVRIKLIERKMKDRNAKTDFSDLLREWMERWLTEQA